MPSIIDFSVTPAECRSGDMVKIVVQASFGGLGGVEVRIPDSADAIFDYRGQLTKILREPIGYADDERVTFRPRLRTKGGSAFLMRATVYDPYGERRAEEETIVDP